MRVSRDDGEIMNCSSISVWSQYGRHTVHLCQVSVRVWKLFRSSGVSIFCKSPGKFISNLSSIMCHIYRVELLLLSSDISLSDKGMVLFELSSWFQIVEWSTKFTFEFYINLYTDMGSWCNFAVKQSMCI